MTATPRDAVQTSIDTASDDHGTATLPPVLAGRKRVVEDEQIAATSVRTATGVPKRNLLQIDHLLPFAKLNRENCKETLQALDTQFRAEKQENSRSRAEANCLRFLIWVGARPTMALSEWDLAGTKQNEHRAHSGDECY